MVSDMDSAVALGVTLWLEVGITLANKTQDKTILGERDIQTLEHTDY
jgi:capsular polysaccharide biosynthesis protein